MRHKQSAPGGYRRAAVRAGAVVREQLAIDRTRLVPAERHVRAVQVLAWCAIAGLFLAGWGEGTVMALRVLLGALYVPTPYDAATVGHQLLTIAQPVAVTVVAVAVLVLFRRLPAPGAPFPVVRRSTWLKTLFVAQLGPLAGFTLLSVFRAAGVPSPDYPHPPIEGGGALLLYVLNSAMAGPSEELALLAVVVTVLRRAGYGWTTVCITAVAVRVPFHMYYGWGALSLSVWALLMVALYRRTGTAVPIALAHAFFNIAGIPEFNAVGYWIRMIITLTGALILCWTFLHGYFAIQARQAGSAARATS